MQATPCTAFQQLPAEMLDRILQYLRPTHLLRIRGVSRGWRQAVDDSLGRRHHLHLTGDDVRHANDERLERLLRRMPSLRRLTTDHYIRKTTDHCIYVICSPPAPLSVDVVSRLSGHLERVDLFHFDSAPQPLEGLCSRCPRLGDVTLPRRSAERCAEVLLRRLPSLRRLDVVWSGVRGECLSLLPESLEALSVAYCLHLQPACLRQLTRCPRLRRLDVSCVKGLQTLASQANVC
ncbi:uncharacterized protein LOC119093138 [Pollicipes pollicipes]|uniref:uncharacterized protein LOC119093138 n=1 Tax=Pollicipes pollicipes TaxID=41117 RepID=UPI00188526A8|nr:uncharacterized protein LOC119093138 [Pollicipes pollicipes]